MKTKIKQGLLNLAATFVTLAVLQPAHAGEDALYGPTAPPGSAFVRVYNATSEAEVQALIGPTASASAAAHAASPFVFVPAGSYAASVAGVKLSTDLAADRYYTLAYRGGDMQLLVAPAFSNMLKAQVAMYNLLDAGTVKLQTGDGKATVIEAVAPNSVGVREVNAVRVSLAVFDDTVKLVDAQPVALERGKSFSLFVSGSKTQPVAQWVVY